MKAWGLFLSLILFCAGCATPPEQPVPSSRYGGPPLRDPENFDRAGIEVIRGTFSAGRQPDGNTVVLASADGLIVFDTGRHATHTQKIIDLAEARGQPVAAIINSHWHLDHISGNIPLRERWPAAVVYSNDEALSEALGSFLARGLESNRKAVADPATPAGLAEDLRGDIATVEQGEKLRPDVSIASSRVLTIGDRKVELQFAKAASAGDIWLYDSATGVIAAGDIVTLPAPFLDTACPKEWRTALDRILDTPFTRLIPGHGRELTRADVMRYRAAFNALLDCADGDMPAVACAEAWAVAAVPLLDAQSGTKADAAAYAQYYVESVLRAGKTRADCPA